MRKNKIIQSTNTLQVVIYIMIRDKGKCTVNTTRNLIQGPPSSTTVEPLLSGHLLSGHPLLSGQLSKSRNFCQLNTVNITPVKRPPLLSSRGHLLAVPLMVLLLLLPLLSDHQEFNARSLVLFSQS